MILGHITNTYMLYRLSGRRMARKAVLPLFIFGAVLPDIGDKFAHYSFAGYPGRGVMHSAVMLSALTLILIMVLRRYKNVVLTVYAGALLHIAQDWADLKVILWPFLGQWDHFESSSILEKFRRTYIEMEPFGIWIVEMVSLTYCVALLLVRYKRSPKVNISSPAGR